MISKSLPKDGDYRTRNIVAWLPRLIMMGQRWHWVWLEHVEIREQYTRGLWQHVSGRVLQ